MLHFIDGSLQNAIAGDVLEWRCLQEEYGTVDELRVCQIKHGVALAAALSHPGCDVIRH